MRVVLKRTIQRLNNEGVNQDKHSKTKNKNLTVDIGDFCFMYMSFKHDSNLASFTVVPLDNFLDIFYRNYTGSLV